MLSWEMKSRQWESGTKGGRLARLEWGSHGPWVAMGLLETYHPQVVWTLHFINFKKKARTTPCTDKHIRSSVATPSAKKWLSLCLSLSLFLTCLLALPNLFIKFCTHMHTQKRYNSTNRSALLDNENNTTKWIPVPPSKKKVARWSWPHPAMTNQDKYHAK